MTLERWRALAREKGPDLLAWVAIVAVLIQGWWTRYALNPDGVSYLDLAARLRAGDVGAFVQGYWSPAFPFLIALCSTVTGGAPRTMLLVAHGISVAAVIGAILLLLAWGKRSGRPRMAVASLLALLVVTDGFPKFETVTPDLLLLAVMVWLGYELLARDGERWKVVGIVLGLAFLVKTSAWPWILLALPLRLWAATGQEGRRRVLWSSAITAAIAALWILPLSIRSGSFTAGSAARLNYAWYLLGAADDRTPDSHRGAHTAYRQAALDSSQSVTWADFGDADKWTYSPWSDPTAWDHGFVGRRLGSLQLEAIPGWLVHQSRNVFRFWLLPFFLVVVIPWGVVEWLPALRQRRWEVGRQGVVAAALGAVGVAEFIVMHAEPRLVAPYALLLGLAILHGPPGLPAPEVEDRLRALLVPPLALAGLVVATLMTRDALREGRGIDATERSALGVIDFSRTTLERAGVSEARVVVVGPAIPVMSAAWLSGAHIVAQVLPRSLPPLRALPTGAEDAFLMKLFASKAQVIWMTSADGSITVLSLPAAPPHPGSP